jgi:hypothetical protein
VHFGGKGEAGYDAFFFMHDSPIIRRIIGVNKKRKKRITTVA